MTIPYSHKAIRPIRTRRSSALVDLVYFDAARKSFDSTRQWRNQLVFLAVELPASAE